MYAYAPAIYIMMAGAHIGTYVHTYTDEEMYTVKFPIITSAI
jgi:hypothetical protein